MGVGATDQPPQWNLDRGGGRPRHGQRDTEDRIRAETALVVGAVRGDQGRVDGPLVQSIDASHRGRQLARRVRHRATDAQASEARPAVAKLDSLECSRGGTRGHHRAAARTRQERHVDLDCRIAP